MHELMEYQNKCIEINVLFDQALQSNSIKEKENALHQFEKSGLTKLSDEQMLRLAHEHGITVKLINLTKTLPTN